MANWTAKVAAAFHTVARGLGRGKVKSTPFDETNGNAPFNASGVVQVGPGRFIFVDNHDPSALFELALDANGREVERISRRPLAGLVEGGRFLPSDARRRSRMVRGASFFAGAGAAGASGLAGSPGFAAGVLGFVGVLSLVIFGSFISHRMCWRPNV